MASPSESTYGDIQMNERYKRLRRNLKMTLMKEAERRNTDNGVSDNPTWPNVSSINGDNLDTSSIAVSLYSKNGSEVVSSSTNMRNVLSHQSQKKVLNTNTNINNNKENIATSSVKQFSSTNKAASASELMPPPKSIGILAHSSRHNSPANGGNSQINVGLHNMGMGRDYGISSSSVHSSRCPSSEHAQDTSQVVFEKEMRDEIKSGFAPVDKPDRIFSKWRVMLNDKGQLIIKGTLECGKVARSKPVIRRLSAISVQSIFNHIYNLNGNIYDERNELPEYIRGKFFNGFPDDWENVYQVWRNFVAEGSKINFRWPTPITDSDDDLKSEITEIISPRKIGRRPRLRSDSLKNQNHTKYSPELLTATNRTLTTEEAFNCTQCQCSVANSVRNESIITSKNISKIANNKSGSNIDTPSLDQNHRVELNGSNSNFIPSYRSNINVTSLKDVLPEDKINIILENLNSKSCSIEYIDKIFQMYDCFRYIMSYKSEIEPGTDSVRSTNEPSDKNQPENGNVPRTHSDATFTKSRVKRKNISQSSTDYDEEDKSPSNVQQSITKMKTYVSSSSTRKQRIRRRLSRKDYDSSDSYENNENDSDCNTIDRSDRRIFKSHDLRSTYRKTSTIGRKLSHRHTEKSDESDGDDYVPAKGYPLRIPAGTRSHERVRSAAHSITQKNIGATLHTNAPRNVAVDTRSASHRFQRGNLQPSANSRNGRASSMSTIGGFLKNYDSSVSITEDESKTHIGKNDARRQFQPGTQSNSRNTLQYYDSSVSITEDEFCEVRGGIQSMRKQVLQECNAQSLQQMSRRSVTGPDNFPRTSRPLADKILPNLLSKISEMDEVSRRESTLNNDGIGETISDANREIISMDAGENRNEIIHMNSPELKMNGQTIAEQLPSKPTSPEKNKKLAIIDIVNTSIHLGPKSVSKPRLQNLDSLNKVGNELPAIEHLRPSKSLDDRKRTGTATDELSVITDQLKALPKSKSLTVKVHGINDMTEDNQSVGSKSVRIDKEKGVFGSENNPKRLTAWVPKVLQKSGTDYGLVFEGKLLNEAGHVVNRKFATDFISTRISLKTVKTESDEFYQLVGDLTDTKHTMPKELQKLCFNGCPSKIPQFCDKWKKLVLDNSSSSGQMLNISKDIQNMPISSRGRRILPPLCYWKGERVTMRDNQVVYSPGNSQDSSLLSAEISQRNETQNSSKRKDTSAKDTTISTKKNSSAVIVGREKSSAVTEEMNPKNRKVDVLSRMPSNCESHIRRTRRSGCTKNEKHALQQVNFKRTLSRQLSPHSSDSMHSDNEPSKPKRRRARNDNSMTNLEDSNEKRRVTRTKVSKRSLHTSNIHTLDEGRKNQKYKSPGRRNNQNDKSEVPDTRGMITYKYRKRINRESELSDDQISNI